MDNVELMVNIIIVNVHRILQVRKIERNSRNELLIYYLGLHCEFPTCESIPCQHNGTCTPDSDRGFLCNCTGTGRKREINYFFQRYYM